MERIEKFKLTQQAPQVPKEGDKNPCIELLPEGYTAAMLSFEFKSGSAIAFPYHLLSNLQLEPSKELLLQFYDKIVSVQGIQLKELYTHIQEQRVKIIREVENRGFDVSNGRLWISKVELTVM